VNTTVAILAALGILAMAVVTVRAAGPGRRAG
jgi:hypothetical protein